MKRRQIAWMMCAALCGPATSASRAEAPAEEASRVSTADLRRDSKRYDGRRVLLEGYVHYHFGANLAKSDYLAFTEKVKATDGKNWCARSREDELFVQAIPSESGEKSLDRRHVTLVGTYKASPVSVSFGCVVFAGPPDFAGRLEDVSVHELHDDFCELDAMGRARAEAMQKLSEQPALQLER